MTTQHHWINGKIVVADQAFMKVNDLGLLRGMGIFDYLLIRNGSSLFMAEHIERLFRSAAALDMEVPISQAKMEEAIRLLVQTNKQKDVGIRLLLTGGYADDGYTFSGKPNFMILQHAFKAVNPGLYKKGFHLMTHNHQRELPEIKSTNYLLPITLKKQLDNMEADDVLYCFDNHVAETSRTNFFIINEEGTLITSVGNILKGITRDKTLEIAGKIMKVEDRLFTMDEMWRAKEAFITSTTKGVLAVTKIDNKVVGNGYPGEKTLLLAAQLNKLIADHLKMEKNQILS